jgi:hypothetical protein
VGNRFPPFRFPFPLSRFPLFGNHSYILLFVP